MRRCVLEPLSEPNWEDANKFDEAETHKNIAEEEKKLDDAYGHVKRKAKTLTVKIASTETETKLLMKRKLSLDDKTIRRYILLQWPQDKTGRNHT